MKEALYVTGMGIVSALGAHVAPTYEALRAGRGGIGPLQYLATQHHHLPCGEVPFSDAQLYALAGVDPQVLTTRTALLGAVALREALQGSGLWHEAAGQEALAHAVFLSGTTVGGMEKSEQFYLDFLNNHSRDAYIEAHSTGACTQLSAQIMALGLGREAAGFAWQSTVSTACSSAANALLLGANLIRTGRTQVAVVGGSECLTRFHLNGFHALRILDTQLCRPFDATRNGLNLGEGAAYLVLESEASVRRRGVAPLCCVSGYGNACDAYHQTASSPNGEGAYRAMQQALREAGLAPEEIDYVNAHGTATPNNDVSEGVALMRLFGEHAVPPVSSTKSFTGHTTSASGAIEAVISILALQHQFLPVNLRFAQKMPELSFTPVTHPTPPRPLRHVLSNSFGFGGNDTSCIFSQV